MKHIAGGVTAPKGFLANGVHCGIRKSQKKLDLGLIYSEVPCHAAGIYTQNKVKGAPILVDQEHLKNGIAQGVIVNSGIANTCAADGIETATKTCEAAALALNIKAEDMIVASTGVIGVSLPIEKMLTAMPELAGGLSTDGGNRLASAMMTTDTFAKEVAVTFEIGGKTCTLGGAAKGSGMINPNMATMLSFLTTDAAVSVEALQKSLKDVADETYNMVSVDGDTSTNDTLTIMANGLAQNEEIQVDTEAYTVFYKALKEVSETLSKMLAKDGEGATKLVECQVVNAPDEKTARVLAKSVIDSSLVKAAMFGADANWGRVLCALGYAEAQFDIHKVEVAFQSTGGMITVCKDGSGISFEEELAKKVLIENEITILVDLHQGESQATAWGCDLSYEYVKINGDYRS